MPVLAVIPARGGSKGIPRKNMRLMNGKPLIGYAIENALACPEIDAVVVSSDSEEILSFAAQYEKVTCLDRHSELAQDAVTLDPVIYDATLRYEAQVGRQVDAVVTLQPTSPLLTVKTLSSALSFFEKSGADTVISVVNKPHLSWTKSAEGKIVPAYEKRLNRQQLPPRYLETGAFFITKRQYVVKDSRLGKDIEVYEVPEVESTDIDTKEDWTVCESLLTRKLIAFRVDGYRELGMGHIFRALTLAYDLIEHDIVFICNSAHREGIEKLRSTNMPVVEVADDDELEAWMRDHRPDVLVNDILDTDLAYIQRMRPYTGRIVNFEDLGTGARAADAVVNAIYEGASAHSNTFTGKRYVALRDEFLASVPTECHEDVRKVVVMFGGSDPLNLSERVYDLAMSYGGDHGPISFEFILGPGYKGRDLASVPERGITVVRDLIRVSDAMRDADLAFCSQGRSTFELASMGVPTIVLAQNERERLHTFAQMDNGFINLGLGSAVTDEDIEATFNWLVGAKSVRREMHNLMLANDLKPGIRRVKRIILGETL